MYTFFVRSLPDFCSTNLVEIREGECFSQTAICTEEESGAAGKHDVNAFVSSRGDDRRYVLSRGEIFPDQFIELPGKRRLAIGVVEPASRAHARS